MLLNRERIPPDSGPVERYADEQMAAMSISGEQAKLPVNQQQLKAAWDRSNVTTRAEWLEWIRRLGNELMRESPSQAIRASRGLAEVYPPFGKELFNVAFVSCWTELFDGYQVS
jgi:FKBP12-rapamycin complex-associated protein